MRQLCHRFGSFRSSHESLKATYKASGAIQERLRGAFKAFARALEAVRSAEAFEAFEASSRAFKLSKLPREL